MDQQEYDKKYANLRILKSVQQYLKDEEAASTSVYPVTVPKDLLYQVLRREGPEKVDELVHRIFKLGLRNWSDHLYERVFGSEESLEEFIELVKKRNK
jgi:hypothetical protein